MTGDAPEDATHRGDADGRESSGTSPWAPRLGISLGPIIGASPLVEWAKVQNRVFDQVFPTAALLGKFSPLGELQRQRAARIAEVVRPLQLQWQHDLAKIVSPLEGLAKSWAATTEVLLPKLPDFAPQLAELIEQFREQWRRASPPNWPEDEYSRVLDLVADTGWSVVWVPDRELLEQLLGAETGEERAALLVEHGATVAGNCRAAVSEITTERLAPYVSATDEAAQAFHAGFPRAAQALASSVVTALIHEELGYSTFKEAREKTTLDPADAPIAHLRLFVIVSTVPKALTRYFPGDQEIPDGYSRHGTAHTVSPVQYTPANALAALMLAASLARELDQRSKDGLDLEADEAVEDDEPS